MKRVLFVNPSPVRGGAEEMLLALCLGFDPERVSARVACLVEGPFPDELEKAGIAVRRLRAGRLREAWRYVATVRTISRLAREADLVFSWQVKGHYYGTPAARMARRPAVWWDHGIRPLRGQARFAIDSLLPRSVRADAVVCSSYAAAAAIPGAVAVHPGIELERFVGGTRAGARAALGVPADALAIGIVGRLQPWKGQHIFLRAAARLAPHFPDAVFLVIGGTPGGFSSGYPASLRALARELGIEERVVFTGHRDDVPDVLCALDVFVHCSKAEPFGISIVEAMAAGVPVVAARGGGVSEIVIDDQTGLLVEHGHVAGTADAIARLLGDSTLAQSFASAARERAASQFSVERMIEDVTSLVERFA